MLSRQVTVLYGAGFCQKAGMGSSPDIDTASSYSECVHVLYSAPAAVLCRFSSWHCTWALTLARLGDCCANSAQLPRPAFRIGKMAPRQSRDDTRDWKFPEINEAFKLYQC